MTLTVEDSGGPVGESFYAVDGTLVWFRFLPEPGETYTATVTLVCGEETLTYTESFTIPEDADQELCNCCTQRKIVSVSISGFTGTCCSWINGTYAVTFPDPILCAFNSVPDPLITYAEPSVDDRCDEAAACFSFSHPYSIGGGFETGTDFFYFFPRELLLSATLPGGLGQSGSGVPDVIFRPSWYVYRLRVPTFGSPVCSALSGTQYQYRFRSSCNSEAMFLHDKIDSLIVQVNTPAQAVCGSITPTVTIEIVDR
jgi:hypothetical protein